MANNTNSKQRGRKPATTSEATTNAVVTETVVEETPVVKEKTEKKPTKKTFASDDRIVCKSLVAGTLYMEGQRTHMLYQWVALGDEVEVEYQDLVAAINGYNDYFKKPYILVMDEDFVNNYPQLQKIYENMYSVSDLRSVLRDGDADDMIAQIELLPDGLKSQIKNIASGMIANGSLDSIQKVKALDNYFGINLTAVTQIFAD